MIYQCLESLIIEEQFSNLSNFQDLLEVMISLNVVLLEIHFFSRKMDCTTQGPGVIGLKFEIM